MIAFVFGGPSLSGFSAQPGLGPHSTEQSFLSNSRSPSLVVIKAAELESTNLTVSQVTGVYICPCPHHPSCRAPGSQAGTESKGVGCQRRGVPGHGHLQTSAWQSGPAALPDVMAGFCCWTKHHEATACLCWASSWGNAPVAPCLLPGWDRAKATGELGTVQYRARPASSPTPCQVSPQACLCRSAEVQAQQQL